MPYTVHVENFQSLSDVTVVVDGFTVITGTNNSGKSALMRAIRGAFQNTRGTSYIRHGTTKTAVEITFDDGRKLRWEKGKGAGDKPTYIIDDGKPLHPGQAVPDEVRELGVKPLNIGGREIWPQFAPQFTGQIFLLDQPGSVLAEAVSDVNHVSQLNDALRMAESDKRSAQSELRVRLKDQTDLEATVKKYDGVDELDAEVAAIEADHAKVIKIGNVVYAVQILKDRHQTAQEAVANLEGIEGVTLPDDTTFRAAQSILDDLATVSGLKSRRDATQDAIDRLAGVEDIDIPDDTTLAGLLDDCVATGKLKDRMVQAQSAVDKLTGIPEIEDLDTTDAESLLDEANALGNLRDRWIKASDGVSSIEADLTATDRDLEGVAKDIEEILGGLGECPVCGSPHDGVHV